MAATIAPPPADLLIHLGRHLGIADLAFETVPTRILGGNETTIYHFTLDGLPAEAPLAGELILRIFSKPQHQPGRARREGAIHNALVGLHYPVPPVLFAHENGSGPPWLVMPRLQGHPLGSAALDLPAGLLRLPRIIRDTATRMATLQMRLHDLPPEEISAHLIDWDTDSFGARSWFDRGRRLQGSSAEGEAIDWLEARLVPFCDSATQVPCHGDFHPLNVLEHEGAVTGVIDWGAFTLAPREFDVGNTLAVLTLTQLRGAFLARRTIAWAMQRLANQYSALIAGSLNRDRVRQSMALRALIELLTIRRRGEHLGDIGGWDTKRLRQTVETVTGIDV